MATDATGAPTPLGIPKYNTSADAPSGLGFNAAMDALDALIAAKVGKPSGIASGEVPVWNGSAFVRSSVTNVGPTSLGSGTPDATKFLRGDGTWSGVGLDGWNALTATLTYSSTDGHTFVVTSDQDLTGAIPLGARVKLTHSASTKYFIVTAIAAGTITLYGGTNYTLAATAITSPYYSITKSPFGFPLDPTVWTEQLKDTTNRTQASPVNGTWYNLGSLSLAIPIGAWAVSYAVQANPGFSSIAEIDEYATLSTANNTESDVDFTSKVRGYGSNDIETLLTRTKTLLLAAKTSYFLNAKTQTGVTSINHVGGDAPTIIRAASAYL